ncbi:MAG: hypothetical protein MJE77_23325 [Proteobacteria bacterium]|nr:hypothetical protein [Pseudomonadota bacterium]
MKTAHVCIMGVLILGACANEQYVSVIQGYLVGSQPIAGAEIQLLEIDDQGNPIDVFASDPAISPARGRTTISNVDGTFEIVLDESEPLPSIFLLRAIEGQTTEFWMSDEYTLETQQPHTHAVVTDWISWATGRERKIVLSPFTELAYQLAKRRTAGGLHDDFEEAVTVANWLLDEHISIDSEEGSTSIAHTRPSREKSYAMVESVRYHLALQQLAALAYDVSERTGLTVTTQHVTACLSHDLINRYFDGSGVEHDGCWFLEQDTFRVSMARPFLRHYVRSDYNKELIQYGDMFLFVNRIAENESPLLFAAPAQLPLDEELPVIHVLSKAITEDGIEIQLFVEDDSTGIFVSDDITRSGIRAFIPHDILPIDLPVEFLGYRHSEYLFAVHVREPLSTTIVVQARDQYHQEFTSVEISLQ